MEIHAVEAGAQALKQVRACGDGEDESGGSISFIFFILSISIIALSTHEASGASLPKTHVWKNLDVWS